MLFNSIAFIFGFFPAVFVGFFVIARRSSVAAGAWLALASLFFYGWWSIKAVPLLLGSVCCNYLFGKLLSPAENGDDASRNRLAIAIALNLALLGFFKYADFFIANTNVVLGAMDRGPIRALNVVLPIGISFFTFTQIAFLVDCWQGKVKERNFIHYLLFVTYFPHLIAGPILHHSQMMPQFATAQIYRPNYDKIAVGLGIFVIGLSKKLLLADPLASYADIVFEAARHGTIPPFVTAWFGVLAYAFQIYFDFSGYSDMAIGLSLFFGIHLPINFNSPYKATSIIDFWRRWHITLSRFLRDYLYIPLGGNRFGTLRRYLNLLATMVLGGLWHGANWTFVLWGAAHGVLLTINHLWREWIGGRSRGGLIGTAVTGANWLVTFVCVCLTWVLFRSDSFATALTIYKGLFGEQFSLDASQMYVAPILALGLFIVLVLPNAEEVKAYRSLTRSDDLAAAHTFPLSFSRTATIALSVLFFVSLLMIGQNSPFLYFQF
jgi:alginate O-acetyltransferase complex protein AlgI